MTQKSLVGFLTLAKGLARIVEGVRIFRAVHAAHLVVSAGAPAGKVPWAIG